MILANVIQSAFRAADRVFQQILVGVHSVVGGSWGWSIIGLTLIVRTVTRPADRAASSRAWRRCARTRPRSRIQERYKDDSGASRKRR